MDDKNYQPPGRTEPGFDTEHPADTVDVQPLFPELDDVPAWVQEQAVAAPEGGGWRQTLKFWAGSLVALALVFLATMWLFDERGGDRAVNVAAMNVVAGPAQAVRAPARVSTLPPLVLLQPGPGVAGKPEVGTSVTSPQVAVVKETPRGVPNVVHVPPRPPVVKLAPLPPKAQAVKLAPLPPKLPVAKLAARPPAPKAAVKPVLAKAAPKPAIVPKALPQAPRKAVLAKVALPQAKAKPKLQPAAKKSAVPAKRAPVSVLAKAKPKVLAGVTSPPVREPVRAPAATPATAPAPTPVARCQPGGLARDC